MKCSLEGAKWHHPSPLDDPMFLDAAEHHAAPPSRGAARGMRAASGLTFFSFFPSQLTEIMQLMNAYFSATRCQQGKGDDVDISKAESTAVGFKHLASTLTPTLLELPSHPV